MTTIPKNLPACTSDMFNYTMSCAYVPQIHLLIDFEKRIDSSRMYKALRIILDAEPVLGCRFVPRWIKPYWTRLTNDETVKSALMREQTGDEPALQNAFEHFLAEPMNELQGPQVKAVLLRGKESDRLIVKLNHQVVDAGGAKDFGCLLASLYRKLDNDPDINPLPNFGTRSLRQVYGQFSFIRLLRVMRQFFIESWGNIAPYKSITYPSGNEKIGTCSFVFKRFSRQRVSSLRTYCAKRSATINDLMVTALLRAIVRQIGWSWNGAARMVGTVDLRRYLPDRRAKALCNLSSFCFLNLGQNLGNGFDETLSNVKKNIDARKADNLGLGFIFGSYLFMLPYPFVMMKVMASCIFYKLATTGNVPPLMTNLGPINVQGLDFGSPHILAAEILAPPCCPPFLVVGLSGYKDTLTLSVGFFESAMPRIKLEELFEFVDQELPD